MPTASKPGVVVTVKAVPVYDEAKSERTGIKQYHDSGERIVTVQGQEEDVRPFMEAIHGVLQEHYPNTMVKAEHG